jgi:ribonuclease HII
MKNDNINVKELIATLKVSTYDEYLKIKEDLKDDTRKNIQNALNSRQKKHEKELKLIEEYIKRKKYETALYKSDFKLVAGIDEVGRGPLAGPVYTAAVILDPAKDILGIKDSKKLEEAQRDQLSAEIIDKCIAYSIGIATEEEIDSMNILNATKLAMQRAVEGLSIKPDYLLIDALNLESVSIPQLAIIKGDDLSVSIGAASIVAKVARDSYMKELATVYPEYSFEKNKGYGTKDHIDAIKKYGITKIHRKSFVKNFI